jgi:hypothetical protein
MPNATASTTCPTASVQHQTSTSDSSGRTPLIPSVADTASDGRLDTLPTHHRRTDDPVTLAVNNDALSTSLPATTTGRCGDLA